MPLTLNNKTVVKTMETRGVHNMYRTSTNQTGTGVLLTRNKAKATQDGRPVRERLIHVKTPDYVRRRDGITR